MTTSAGGDASQLDTLELHMDGGAHELDLPETRVPAAESEAGSIVTEPVLGVRMLMSSRVSGRPGGGGKGGKGAGCLSASRVSSLRRVSVLSRPAVARHLLPRVPVCSLAKSSPLIHLQSSANDYETSLDPVLVYGCVDSSYLQQYGLLGALQPVFGDQCC